MTKQEQREGLHVHTASAGVSAGSGARVEAIKDIISSFMGATACVYTGQPFDTIKVKLQTAKSGQFGGTLDCIRQIFVSEGVTKLWAGSIPALTGAVSENVAAFTLNNALKRVLGETTEKDKKSYGESFATGAITGFFIAFVLCPCDVIKCRSQIALSRGLDASASAVFNRTIAKEGMKGLYVGLGPQIIRDIPFYTTFFGCYDSIGRFIKNQYPTLPEPLVYAFAGGFAGQAAWICSIIPDAIKSTIQTAEPSERARFWPTMQQIIRTRGIYRGLFAGIEVTVIRAFPANAALFVGYEYTKKMLDRYL